LYFIHFFPLFMLECCLGQRGRESSRNAV